MSGIFGCWAPDGGPLDHAALLACAPFATLQPHAVAYWAPGSIALAGESSRPLQVPGGDVTTLTGGATTCVFDGRLDDVAALRRRLDPHPLVVSGCGDANLVVAAYDQLGDDFVRHLDGDFALALFDTRLKRLFLARDKLGVRPLCYTRSGGLFLFGSNAKAILGYPGITAIPDESMLADFVLSFPSREAESRTFFEGIHSLQPAHILTVTREELSSRRYFDFDTRRQTRASAWPEYVDGFHELFVASVRNRLRSDKPVAVTVSGGLDSAYIFCAAQSLVRNGEASCPAVLGFNYAGRPGTPSDENAFVQAIETACGTSIQRIPQRPGFVGAARRSVAETESPMVDRLACQADVSMRLMRDAGAGRLLTGHWGDQLLSDSDYLLDLLKTRRWKLLQQHLRGWDMSGLVLARRAVRTFAARYLPPAVKLGFRTARGSYDQAPWNAPWFTRRFQRLLRERAASSPVVTPRGTSHATAIYRQSRMGYHVHCMEWNHRIAGMHGLEIAFPYLDCALIQFLMSIPGDIQSRGGVPRGLMRAAMRRIVPEVVVNRTCKGEFTQLANETIECDFRPISELLSPAALSVQFGYLDGTVLRDSLPDWRTTVRASRNSVVANRLLDLCGFELFLRGFFAVDQSHAAVPLIASAQP
jgi:asparagine synthase (glutamine-hydrolysing)